VEDCAASYFPKFHDAVVEMVVAQGGIVGWAAPLAALRAALQDDADAMQSYDETSTGLD